MEEKITAWIARDESEKLFMYTRKPAKSKSCEMWYLDTKKSGTVMEMDMRKFPQVKWEDEEPTKVELTIKIKE